MKNSLRLLLVAWLTLAADVVVAYTLSGTVYGNGVPMPNATVRLLLASDSSQATQGTTDPNGLYSLDVGDGSYYMLITPPVEASDFVVSRVNNIVINGSNLVRNVALVAGTSLRGIVQFYDGTPVANIHVTVQDQSTGSNLGTSITDSSGAYALTLAPGTYKYYIDGGPATFLGHPSIFVISNAYQNTVVSGTTIQDIVLPVAFLSGRVVDTTGAGVGITQINSNDVSHIRPDGSACRTLQSFATDSSGNYTMALCDGFSYVITAVPPQSSGLPANRYEGVAVNGNASRDFVLQPGVVLSGTVKLADGTPVSNMAIDVIDQNTSINQGRVFSDASGIYSVTVPQGTYKFHLDGHNATYPGAGWLLIYNAFPNTSVTAPTALDMVLPLAVLSGKTTRVGGEVVGGVRLTNVDQGYILPDGSTCRTTHDRFSASDGTYEMALCAGFSYIIDALPPGTSGLPTNVFKNVSTSIATTRDFVLTEATLSGVIRFSSGTPVSRMLVNVIDESTSVAIGSTFSASDGIYRIAVPDGTYKFYLDGGETTYPERPAIFVYANAYPNTVVSGPTTRDMQLPLVLLSGLTTDSNAVPIGGIRIDTNDAIHPRTDGSTCRATASKTSNVEGAYAMVVCNDATYIIYVIPPVTSGFSNSSIASLPIAGDTGLNILLQMPDNIAPRILSGPLATQIGTASATVVWETDEPAKGAATWTGGSVVEADYRTQHAALLTGLSPLTPYTVTVSATDRSNRGPTTASVTFTTANLPDTTSPLIVDGPAVTAITHNSAVVSWETNEPATTVVGGDVATTVLGYRSLHRVELTGLTSERPYAITISSVDAAGNAPTSRSLGFTTLAAPDTTPPVITKGPWSTDITADAATVRWETDEPANSGLSFNDGTAYGVLNDDALTVKHSVRMNGLQSGTTYTVTVSSKDAAGNGPILGTPFPLTTLTGSDSRPPVFTTLPQVCNVNHQLIHLCFDTDEPASALVEYGLSSSALAKQEARAQLIQHHSIPINGLLTQTSYFLRVKVKDGAGNEAISDVLEISTTALGSAQAPQFLQVPTASYVGKDRVILEWETDRPCRGVVEYGQGSYGLQRTESAYKTKQRVVITNLGSEASYQFRVTVTDVDGLATTQDM